MKYLLKFFLWFMLICIAIAAFQMLMSALPYIVIAMIPVALVFAGWWIYEFAYFRGQRFKDVKDRISTYIADCNDLNAHIESLKDTALVINRATTGIAEYKDASNWNMKRPELGKRRNAPNVYDCSRTVCDNARKSPFKYICKYFGVSTDEESLSQFETILNNFEAAEEGKLSLLKERQQIMDSIKSDVPFLIRNISKKKLEQKLGFDPVDFSEVYFPKYIFRYTSSGGNTATECSVTMDIKNLNDFVQFLSEKIKFKQSAAGQRALMTSRLRQHIKERDNFTCKCCGVSVEQEPHLLLEIDHIVPVSKGGLTAEDNLQTLCWRCNRSKGAKM